MMPNVLVKLYLHKLSLIEYIFILLLAKSVRSFDKSLETQRRHDIQTLKNMEITPAKSLHSMSLLGRTIV